MRFAQRILDFVNAHPGRYKRKNEVMFANQRKHKHTCEMDLKIKQEPEETTHVFLPVKTETVKAEPLDLALPESTRRHRRGHAPLKYACSVCGYAAPERKDLKRHMLVHTGEKPYTCPLCAFRCRQKGYLKDHMKTHDVETPKLFCHDCGFSTVWRGSLIVHVKMHKADRPFRCAECDMTFSVRGYLKKHMFTHTKEKPFHCTFCNYKAYRNYHLKVHFRKHEKEKVD